MKLHRLAWLVVVGFLLLFLADGVVGFRTISLRIAFVGVLALAATLLIADWISAWMRRVDPVGLAYLLEQRYPELAERVVTLVQVKAENAPSALAPMLEAETARCLAAVNPDEACSMSGERQTWLRTLVVLTLLFVGLGLTSAFGAFAHRFFGAWAAPLVPFEISAMFGTGYALRGSDFTVEASVFMLDPNADVPPQLELVCQDGGGATTTLAMLPTNGGRFAVTLTKVHQPLHCTVQEKEAASVPFEIHLVDVPLFTRTPSITVLPPSYLRSAVFDVDFNAEHDAILEYSLLSFWLSLDHWGESAEIRVRKQPASENGVAKEFTIPVPTMKPLVAVKGTYQAELVVNLEHGLSATLPLGQWTVREDSVPRFTQPLRLQGGSALLSSREYRLNPGDAVKLRSIVEDSEGIGDIGIEFRINDQSLPIAKWLSGGGAKKFIIDDWLPLPSSLKEKDRVQFRIHAADKRRMKKGEAQHEGVILPREELLPQVAIAPAALSGADAWITLRIDQSVEGYLKREVAFQADEVRDVILKIKKKVESETDDAQRLQRSIHLQSALTQPQVAQAARLVSFNDQISDDLRRAYERFADNPDLAGLAEHFLEIAETDIAKSAVALNRMTEKDRALVAAELDLKTVQEALLEARTKLERMLEWNKAIAEDRLDRFQIDTLVKRQTELAERLKQADGATEMEAIRHEQAKLAEQTAQLQETSRLIQESLAALQAERTKRLADTAEQIAAQQQKMREADPDQLPAQAKDQLAKLAEAQVALAERVKAFAETNDGPDVMSAHAAAGALKKPAIDEALKQQREHEYRLKDWLSKLVPGAAVNALRDEVLRLAKKQKAIHADLEKLGKDVPSLDEKTLKQRLGDLTARQKDMPAAISKLAIDAKDERLHAGQRLAEQTAKQAGDQLAVKDALTAFDTMEKAQQALEALANRMPAAVPIKRDDIKDPTLRARIDQVEAFAREQEKLRKETERLLAEAMKAGAKAANRPLQEKTEKLAADLMELAQTAVSPQAKAMAKESAQAVAEAKKAMDASQEAKAKGDVEKAKVLDDEAAKKLGLALKQTAKLAQDPSAKDMAKNPKTAEALKESSEQMRKAEANLPAMPKEAQIAMKSAAKSLEQASQQAGRQSASRLPKAARSPGAKSFAPLTGGRPSAMPKELQLESMGKTWGELPGELKTQMLQDVRDRFGEEYAQMIQHYFERVAETPTPARKERP